MATVPLAELVPYRLNPRRGNVRAIAASLKALGQYRPIVANTGTHTGRPGEVLAGNHTLAAARTLKWSELEVHWVDVDESTAARIVAADNRTHDLGEGYDQAELGQLLSSLELPELDGTGYSEADLERLMGIPAEGSADHYDRPTEEPYVGEYGVTVVCSGEENQEAVYQELHALGYECRVVAT